MTVYTKLFTPSLAEFFELMDISFDNGYQELYSKGVLVHAEFFVDIMGEDLSNLILIDKSRRTTTHFKETTYQGQRLSPLGFILYDKAKELTDKGKVHNYEKLVRLEARLNRKDIRFKDFVEDDFPNPFSNVLVANVNQVQSTAEQFNKAQFVSKIKESGLTKSGINLQTRRKIIAHLKENTMPWWQPELFWEQHREMLADFKSVYLG